MKRNEFLRFILFCEIYFIYFSDLQIRCSCGIVMVQEEVPEKGNLRHQNLNWAAGRLRRIFRLT